MFDEVDHYLARTIPHAMDWIKSGLDVRFNAVLVAQVVGCIEFGVSPARAHGAPSDSIQQPNCA